MPSTASPLCASVSAIVALNSEGIRSLQAKDFAGSITTLSKAISDLKRFLAESEEENWDCHHACHDLLFGFQMDRQEEFESMDVLESPFVFETPIKVTRRRVNKSEATPETISDMLKMLSFALVFNLAIAFHLGAIHHRSGSIESPTTKKRLMKALAFYKLSLNMIQNQQLALGVMESIAVANNQAHVYLLLGQGKQAEECYQQVLSDIMYVADSGNQREIPLFERFFANVVKPSPTAKAA